MLLQKIPLFTYFQINFIETFLFILIVGQLVSWLNRPAVLIIHYDDIDTF